jgi:membrane-associated phospholipid phosphatase
MTWGAVKRAINRPYRVPISMILLVLYVPFYLLIAERSLGRVVHVPKLALDDLFPVIPGWALVYGALYLFLILLPVVVVQDEELIRRTVRAYLAVWTVSYVCFLLYPTVAQRPETVLGGDFGAWGLRFLYDADPPYNCFPSLHVAHSFVSGLAVYRVNRSLGLVAVLCASVVALSTLFIKQHYFADVIAGIILAFAACAVLLRSPSSGVPEFDRRVAPYLALFVSGIVCFCVAIFWVLYVLGIVL